MLKAVTLWLPRAGGIMKLAWPLVLSSTSIMMMQFSDALFLAHWSARSLAAVTPAGIWVLMLTALFQGLVSYGSTFIAQSRGGGKDALAYRFSWQVLWLGLLFGSLLTFATPLATGIFSWVGHPADIVTEEVCYAEILLYSSLITLLNHAFTAVYVGYGKTRIIGILQFFSMLLNILLNWLLIFGPFGLPQLGIAGAAIGTVVASALLPAVLGYDFYRSLFRARIVLPEKLLLSRLCRFGFADGLRFLVDVGIWTAFTFVIGRLGSESLAANNMALRLTSLVWLPLYGLGRATGQIVGMAVGARELETVRNSVRAGIVLGVLWALLWGTPMLFCPQVLLGWMPITADATFLLEVGQTGKQMLQIASILGIFDAINTVVQGGLLGAGDTRWTMRSLIAVHGFFFLAMLWGSQSGLTASQFWGLSCLDQLLLALLLLARFRKGLWLEHEITKDLPLDLTPFMQKQKT